MVPTVTPKFPSQKDLGNSCLVLGFCKRNSQVEDLNGSNDTSGHLSGNTVQTIPSTI